MLKNTSSVRLCMCCGEKKDIEKGAAYCTDCSTPTGLGSALFSSASTKKERKGLYTISSINPLK